MNTNLYKKAASELESGDLDELSFSQSPEEEEDDENNKESFI